MAAPDGAEAVEEEMADDMGGLRDYFLVSEEGPELDYVVGRLEFPHGPGSGTELRSDIVGGTERAVPGCGARLCVAQAASKEVAPPHCAFEGDSSRGGRREHRRPDGACGCELEGLGGCARPGFGLSSGTDFPFGVDALGIAMAPDARALSSAVSAESGVSLEEPLAQVNDCLSTLEDAMSKIAAGFKIMMERQQDAPTTPPEPRSRPGLLKAKAKEGARPAAAAAPAGGRVTFANLDPGVALAAQEAGVEVAALAEMDRLVGAAPLEHGLAKRHGQRAPPQALGLSESEDDGVQDDQGPEAEATAQPGDPLSAVLHRLTQVVERLPRTSCPPRE